MLLNEAVEALLRTAVAVAVVVSTGAVALLVVSSIMEGDCGVNW